MKKKSMSVAAMGSIIGIILLVAYNAIVFTLFGAVGHSLTFWMSYAFTHICLISVAAVFLLLNDQRMEAKDWLFGYPFYKHCATYAVVQLIATVVFSVLDHACPWGIAFSVQLLVLAVFMTLIISCFMAKTIIQDQEAEVKDKTAFMTMLRINVESIAVRATDPAVKAAYTKLAEDIGYSDPVSSEQLSAVENNLSAQISAAIGLLSNQDSAGLLQHCQAATLLLTERNKLCGILK